MDNNEPMFYVDRRRERKLSQAQPLFVNWTAVISYLGALGISLLVLGAVYVFIRRFFFNV